jgi:hypothetical protein
VSSGMVVVIFVDKFYPKSRSLFVTTLVIDVKVLNVLMLVLCTIYVEQRVVSIETSC